MRKLWFSCMLIILVILSGCNRPIKESQPVITNAVDIVDFSYDPQSIAISKGTIVTWTQKDAAPHTVTISTGTGFDSGTLNQGQIFSWMFNEAGNFSYYCSIHPGMIGKVIVT